MSEPQRTPHPEQPAEGKDAGGSDESGRTPHAEEPAEGKEGVGSDGADTPG